MKKVFLTFSTSDWIGTRTRLYFRALECGWFDKVLWKDESVVPEKYRHRLEEPFHGFYFWKPIAVFETLKELDDGDILVYADAGSEINLAGYHFFEEKIQKLGDADILTYGLTYLRQFCNPEILEDFGISEEDAQKFPSAQAGQLYIRKTKSSMEIVEEWMNYMLDHPNKIKYDFDTVGDIDGYVQNRGDQSVLGCIFWKYKDRCILERPNSSWMFPHTLCGLEVRASECDILLTRKKFDYKPYVMFVIGQELPFFEKQYDEYTHFLNVGNENLHRMSDKTGENIHLLKGMAEQTGIYWIWKNVDLSGVKYIGISTHRKPFYATNDVMYRLLERGCKAIANLYYQNRKATHLISFDKSLFEDFVDTFSKYHPDEREKFLKHESSGIIYPSNSFVMKVEDFYKLCEFIFPVMLDFAKRHEGEIGKSYDRIGHSVPAGCFGEDIVSYYLMEHIRSVASVPFVIYPKGEELFRAETQPFGMIFGRNGDKFYPFGAAPRTPAIIRSCKQYVNSDDFYPKSYTPRSFPNIIPTKCYLVKQTS